MDSKLSESQKIRQKWKLNKPLENRNKMTEGPEL